MNSNYSEEEKCLRESIQTSHSDTSVQLFRDFHFHRAYRKISSPKTNEDITLHTPSQIWRTDITHSSFTLCISSLRRGNVWPLQDSPETGAEWGTNLLHNLWNHQTARTDLMWKFWPVNQCKDWFVSPEWPNSEVPMHSVLDECYLFLLLVKAWKSLYSAKI